MKLIRSENFVKGIFYTPTILKNIEKSNTVMVFNSLKYFPRIITIKGSISQRNVWVIK